METTTQETPLTVERFFSFYEKTILPRFDLLEAGLNSLIESHRRTDDRFDFLIKKYEIFSEELAVITYQLKGIDQRLENIDDHLSKHDQEFIEINNHLANHDKEFIEINNHLANHDKEFIEIKNRLIQLESESRELKNLVRIKKSSYGKKGPKNNEFQSELARIKLEVTQLQKRMDQFEKRNR